LEEKLRALRALAGRSRAESFIADPVDAVKALTDGNQTDGPCLLIGGGNWSVNLPPEGGPLIELNPLSGKILWAECLVLISPPSDVDSELYESDLRLVLDHLLRRGVLSSLSNRGLIRGKGIDEPQSRGKMQSIMRQLPPERAGIGVASRSDWKDSWNRATQ
jgi:hypothetical protein